jgi:hypothetical protein
MPAYLQTHDHQYQYLPSTSSGVAVHLIFCWCCHPYFYIANILLESDLFRNILLEILNRIRKAADLLQFFRRGLEFTSIDLDPSRLTNSTSVPSPNIDFRAPHPQTLPSSSPPLLFFLLFPSQQFILDHQQTVHHNFYTTTPSGLIAFYPLETPLATFCSIKAQSNSVRIRVLETAKRLDPAAIHLFLVPQQQEPAASATYSRFVILHLPRYATILLILMRAVNCSQLNKDRNLSLQRL